MNRRCACRVEGWGRVKKELGEKRGKSGTTHPSVKEWRTILIESLIIQFNMYESRRECHRSLLPSLFLPLLQENSAHVERDLAP